VTQIGIGQCVGTIAFFSQEAVHTNDVACVRDAEVIKISRSNFTLLYERFPRVLMHFTKDLAVLARSISEVKTNNAEYTSKYAAPQTIAIVPISPTIDIGEFGLRFKVTLFCSSASDSPSQNCSAIGTTADVGSGGLCWTSNRQRFDTNRTPSANHQLLLQDRVQSLGPQAGELMRSCWLWGTDFQRVDDDDDVL